MLVLKKKNKDDKKNDEQLILEQAVHFEKKIYDLEQLLDIAKSFCSTLDFKNLLESIVYICMAQMHVLGAEIFVRDVVYNENFILETSSDVYGNESKSSIPVNSPIASKLLSLNAPITFEDLKKEVPYGPHLEILEKLSPTLIVPLIQKNHLNGILVLQERIAIDSETGYTDYEREQIMSIASLASVAINNAALMEISSTDMMTHLKLKYIFYNILAQQMETAYVNGENLAVLMFDIDHFKKFNDTYGHECGDFVLISVADLIKKSLRETDVASRYGGEEFTVMLANQGKDEAMIVADRIRKTIEDQDFVYSGPDGEKHLHVTISVGVAVSDPVYNVVGSPNEFVCQADKALYDSKNNGRNRISFYHAEKQ